MVEVTVTKKLIDLIAEIDALIEETDDEENYLGRRLHRGDALRRARAALQEAGEAA